MVCLKEEKGGKQFQEKPKKGLDRADIVRDDRADIVRDGRLPRFQDLYRFFDLASTQELPCRNKWRKASQVSSKRRHQSTSEFRPKKKGEST